jgi:hypothetical protein
MDQENQQTPADSESQSTSSESNWQEVGRQFQELGQSLSQAFRAAWENEANQRRLQEVRTGLESMVSDVGKAINDTVNTPEGQKVRQEASRAAESLRTAGEKTVQEVRPQLIDALQQLNNELQNLVNRMDKKTPPPSDPSGGPDVQI